MPIEISSESHPGPVLDQFEKLSGQDLRECYQCGKCLAGCPVSYEMDLSPQRLIRFIQLGRLEDVLYSNTIWLCASCYVCTARCPRNMDIARVMDACRELAVSHSIVARDCDDTYEFHRAFLAQVKKYGRVWELGLIKDYKLRTGHLFQDILVAPLMFLKAKIHLLPKRIRGRKEVRRIFKNCS